ncbi:MAG: alkaline phosphatase family protein [Acidobacteriota bacterium]|nr:alkaline phosphatase family protein [Acidobacteriota bacterium]
MSHRRAFDHVLIIMFENQYRSYVTANPYFRGLARQGLDMACYMGVMHPSQTNYIASIAGELCNVTYDDAPPPLSQRTIVDLIEASPENLRWKAYMDSYIPQNTPWSPELVPKDQYPYVIKHNPFSSFANIQQNKARWSRIVDQSQLWIDLLNGDFPEYAWFTPNMWNDGHYLDGTKVDPEERAPALVDQAAAWLEGFFGALRFPGPDSHLPARTLVVVTFDEADFEKKWDAGKKYTYDGPNQIYTVLLGDMIKPGVERVGYNHYSLLRTIEENFSLGTLGKNDADANWFRFLWGESFRWRPPTPTPLTTHGGLAAAELGGLLYVVTSDSDGVMWMRTWNGDSWSEGRSIDHRKSRSFALARMGDQLLLAFVTPESSLSAVTYDLQTGWSRQSVQLAGGPISALALTALVEGELMLVWRGGDTRIFSKRFASGKWQSEVDTGHETDGSPALAAIGPSLYLVHKVVGSDKLNAVSYNTADFNVVTVATSSYSGPYDDTSKDKWSPSGFPVARFATSPSPVTPKESEPLIEPYRAGAPLVTAALDGVIHLAHPGTANGALLTETFSIAGILTPVLPVSYNKREEKTTSNGYGTLAEASWSEQTAIFDAWLSPGGAMTMARLGDDLVLLIQKCDDNSITICRGGYG